MFKNIFLIMMLGFATNAFATVCPAENVVEDPVLFNWTSHGNDPDNPDYYSGTLEMGEATFEFNDNTLITKTLTTRAYRQAGGNYSIPGPTIVMEPGKKYVLQFRNTLPYEEPSAEHNVFKDPNITNVHTHGVHISGESPGDDVTRFFEGGFGGDFVYDIPADHMGGSYWYHAHHHGSTYLQVSNGAFGLLLIGDGGDNIPANVAAMTEKHIVMGFLDPTSAGAGGDTLVSSTLGATWTTNGLVNGNICMPPDTWQHWRVLVADQDSRLLDLDIGSQCEVKLLARDGVWRRQVPGDVLNNRLTMTAASRADLAVRCSADSSITLGGTPIAQVYVDGASNTSPNPYDTDGTSLWASERPGYLRDLTGPTEVIADTETIRMGARSVLGSKFDALNANLEKTANGIQEWKLNGATNHPFHLHIYHVQVQEDCGPYEAGEYYDVVAGNCTVRFDMSPQTAYEGRTIFHCHILSHEDQGAMGWMDVTGGAAPPMLPTGYSEYYDLGGGGPVDPGTVVQVGSITLSTVNAGKGLNLGQATVLVTDELGNPVEGATVSGEFRDDITESGLNAVTGVDGTVSFVTSESVKRVKNLRFCVTGIAHDTLADFAGEVCEPL